MKKFLFLLPLMILLIVSNTVEAKKKKYPNGDYYEGKWKKGQPHGKGKMIYSNGAIYEGEWVEGLINGKGKFTDVLNNTFEGYFEKGSPRTGKLICNNSRYCEGEFQYFKIDRTSFLSSCKLHNGVCRNYVQNGDSFTGKMLKGRYDEGKLILSNGGWREGKWVEGRFYNGTCDKFERYKETFTGKMLKGKYDEGKLTLANGGWHEGKWVDGRFYNGKSKGNIDSNFYDGVWINGVFQGKCKLNFSNSKEGFKTFEGVIDESGIMDGTVEYADSIIYKGTLKNKKKDGNGIVYASKENIIIEGQWKEDNLIQGKGDYIYTNNTYPFTINKSNDNYNIKTETDSGIITCEQKTGLDKHSLFSKIANTIFDLRKKQEEEEQKKEELIALQKDIANAKYYYWTPSEILRLYEENPAKFNETFYSTILGDGTIIRAKIANIRRETKIGLFGDDIYYNIYLEGGVVIQTYKSSVVSQIRKGQTVFMLAKYQNETTNKYGYTQYPIFRLMTDEFIANSIDAVHKYLKAKREAGYANYYFRNCVRNIYR